MNVLERLSHGALDARHLHAATVHIPVTLALLAAPAALWLAVTRPRRDRVLRRALVVAYAALGVSAALAATWGGGARALMGTVSADARDLVALHARLGRGVAWIALAAGTAAALASSRRPGLAAAARVATAALALAAAGWVSLTAHLGGTALYDHGVGAPRPSLPERAPADPRAAHFAATVRPLLERRCTGCHGPAPHAAGGLDLTSAEGLLRGGARGPSVVPGDAPASRLLRVLTGAGGEPRMPQGGPPLSAAEIDAIRDWIDAGAVWPER